MLWYFFRKGIELNAWCEGVWMMSSRRQDAALARKKHSSSQCKSEYITEEAVVQLKLQK